MLGCKVVDNPIEKSKKFEVMKALWWIMASTIGWLAINILVTHRERVILCLT
jgi:hypothetical protein